MTQTQDKGQTFAPDMAFEEIETTVEERYRSLLRSLRRSRGFNLKFVQCTPAGGAELIERVRRDLPQKSVDVLALDRPIENLYAEVEALRRGRSLEVLFISGIERSLVDDIKPGYGGEGDYYNLNTAPRILGHLNQQREVFRDSFPFTFVFLIPRFAVKYFIRRAADFYDWGAGVFELQTDPKLVERAVMQLCQGGHYLKYFNLSPQQQHEKTVELQTWLAECPEDARDRRCELLLELVRVQFVRQNANLTLTTCDELLKLQTSNSEAWYYKALIKKQINKPGEAVFCLERVLEYSTKDAQGWTNRGNALYHLHRYEESLGCFRRSLQLQPNIADAWNGEGGALYNLGRVEEALNCFQRALDLQSDYAVAWNNQGGMLNELGRYEEALICLDRALKLQPNFADALNNSGKALNELGRYEKALAHFRRAINIQSNFAAAWNGLGNALYHLGKYEEALSSYQHATKLQPNYAFAWNNRGNALYQLGRYEEALSSFQHATKLQPDYALAWNNRGNALYQLGRYEEALSSYQRVLDLQPDDATAWRNRGIALTKLKRYEEAAVSCQRFLELQPTPKITWRNFLQHLPYLFLKLILRFSS